MEYEEEMQIPDSERKRGNVKVLRSEKARRNLDQMNDSIFNPGGSLSIPNMNARSSPATGMGVLHDERHERHRILREQHELERKKFEEGKTKDIESLEKRNRELQQELVVHKQSKEQHVQNNAQVAEQLKKDIGNIREHKEACERDLEIETKKIHQMQSSNKKIRDEEALEMERIAKNLSELRESNAKEERRMKRLTEKNQELYDHNREQIENNESVRTQIIDDNKELLRRQSYMEEKVAGLDSKREILEGYLVAVETKTGRPDMSVISTPDGAGTQPGTNTATKASTPVGTTGDLNTNNRVSFRPYDSVGNRHVGNGVYDPNLQSGDSDGSVRSYTGQTSVQPNTQQSNQGGCAVGNSNSASYNPVRKQYNRRSSMSMAMQGVHDANPCIAGLGIDCCSKSMDGTEIMSWSISQGDRLRGSRNAARRVAKIPRPYNGYRPWKEEYQGFLDDMESSGWNKEESLPHLVSWLKEGPGRVAVEQWRNEYGGHGSYDELLTCASYLFGSLVAEDPMAAFKRRTQKPKESHKVFGLELQSLLTRARPKCRFDDEYFLQDLFTTFIRGLRDPDHTRVAYEAWKDGTSLVDLFLEIDSYDKKKRLLAGDMPSQRVSVIDMRTTNDNEQSDDNSEHTDSSSGDEENIGAIGGDPRYASKDRYRKSNSDKYRKDGNSDKYKKDSRYVKSDGRDYKTKRENWRQEEPKVKVTPVPVSITVPTVPVLSQIDTNAQTQLMLKNLEEKMDRMNNYRPRYPGVDKSERPCYRCQVKGHYSRECTAPHPIPRGGPPSGTGN